MDLNDPFQKERINPQQVLVLRHRPSQPKFNEVLPRLADEKPNLFNAYQRTQSEKVEKAFQSAAYVASFIRHRPGEALFVGLYSIGKSRPLTREQFWRLPEYAEMKKYGMKGFTEESRRPSILWFDLKLVEEFHGSWKGKLVLGWPPPERSWWRRAHKNNFPVLALLEDSALASAIPVWNSLVLNWEMLSNLRVNLQFALSQWRGIYYIFDTSDGKGYVGSAYGEANLFGRWRNYAASGHGGNTLLRKRNPKNFHFSILQLVSQDADASDVIELETTWKERLHTRSPHGLNNN